ncbi:MAG: 30S ribosomal protein S3 [Myxococcales bacterium]|nr:30S ribosomal protein S3 [Myxococcales bacterium]
MGQKTHPYGFRIGIINGWKSNWFGGRDFGEVLHEDLRIREHIKKRAYHAGVSRVVIERRADKVAVNIYAARPGILIGKRGAEVEALRKDVSKLSSNELFINIREIRKAELDGQLVAENISLQLERRVAFRRAMRRVVTSAMKFGAQGIKVMVSGRLGGSEMSRRAQYREGRVPLHTLKARIDFGHAIARTKSGVIGCKAWVFTGYVPDAQLRQLQPRSGDQGTA